MISNSFNKQYLTLFLVCLTLNESVCSFKTITKKCLGDVCTHELAVKNGKSSLLFLFRFYFTYSPPQVILNIIFIKVLSLNNFFCYLIIKKNVICKTKTNLFKYPYASYKHIEAVFLFALATFLLFTFFNKSISEI